MSPKDCSGSSGGKMPQNMKPDAHGARLSISPSVHVALQQIDSSQCIHCSSSPPVLTFSSGCYRSLEWTLHSIYTPLESVDEREGRQKKEKEIQVRGQWERRYQLRYSQHCCCCCFEVVIGTRDESGEEGGLRRKIDFSRMCTYQKPNLTPLCDKIHSNYNMDTKKHKGGAQ